jgi:hypothetical protein
MKVFAMSLRRCSHLFVPVAALALASCGSSPTSAPVQSSSRAAPSTLVGAPAPRRSSASGEIYDGPPALAIAPVVDGRTTASPEISSWLIQKLMAEDLDRTDLFAGVIPLESASAAHEGGLIIQPALTALTWTQPNQRSGSIAMRIRASDTATGRVKLDRVYTASCRDCKVSPGQPAVAGPLAVLMQDVAKDLGQGAIR